MHHTGSCLQQMNLHFYFYFFLIFAVNPLSQAGPGVFIDELSGGSFTE